MFLTKLTTAAAMLLAVSVLAAGALCAYPALTARAKGAKEPGAPKGATGSEPAKGLKLTLSADKAETVIDVEGNFNGYHRVEPVALHLTFTNTGDKPIKVDAYDLAVKHLTMEASGPDADDCAPDHDSSEYNVEDAKAADYPTIKTGGHWSPDRPLSFPDNAGRRGYELFRTGEYRVRVTYRNTGEAGGELAAGSWTGGVTSNWIVLKVVPEAAKPVTAPAEAAEGPTSLDFHKEVPPLSALNIVFKPEARAARSDKKLTLSLKIENGSPDPITATLAHEWHGGLWPPTDLYASVTPAGAKDTRPFVPAYLVGEDQSAARATDVAPGKAVTADVRTDWPGTGSVHGEPLMESGRKYKVRTLLVFRAGGRQQYVVSAATEVEAPPE